MLTATLTSRAMYETAHVRFSFDPAHQCVFGEWKKFAAGQEYRAALEAGLSLLKQHGTGRWCADLTAFQVATPDDQKWTDTDWFPRAVSAGLRKLAVVMPASIIAKTSVERQVNSVGGVQAAYFSSVAEAKAWVRAA